MTDKTFEIREAISSDMALLPEIDAKADMLFFAQGFIDMPVTDISIFTKSKVILVAGRPIVGFALLNEIDGLAHLEQISVLPEHGGKGIGGALLEAACKWSAQNGYAAVTLSTFCDIPWNAPFYSHHGFEVINELTSGLKLLKQHELDQGLSKIGRRVIMRRKLVSL